MGNENIVVVKKKSKFWTVVKILLVVGAIALVAAKIYQKFFKNKKCKLGEAEADEELDALEAAEAEPDVAEEETFEVSADAVITNAEDMEESAEN
ncbi:MAG: hypothetical protein IJF33_00800 [Clostridia bacterium]|nr:hypothetical protein [Clostridia bacterium]